MATLTLSQIKKIDGLNNNEIRLLDEIVFRTKTTGYCWASNSTLSKAANVSVRSVQRYIKKFIEKGILLAEMIYGESTYHVKERKLFVVYGKKQATQVELPQEPKQAPEVKEQAPEVEETQVTEEPVLADNEAINKDTGEVVEIKPLSSTVEQGFEAINGYKPTGEVANKVAKLVAEYSDREVQCVYDLAKAGTVLNPISHLASSLENNRKNGIYLAWENKKQREDYLENVGREVVVATPDATETVSDVANEVVTYLNKKANKSHQANGEVLSMVKELLDSGYTKEDMKNVVTEMTKQWSYGIMNNSLKPEVLFNLKEFAGYLKQYKKNNQTVTVSGELSPEMRKLFDRFYNPFGETDETF